MTLSPNTSKFWTQKYEDKNIELTLWIIKKVKMRCENCQTHKTLEIAFSMSQKCGERPYLFATIAVKANIRLDIAAL
jgi:hypothetical protein